MIMKLLSSNVRYLFSSRASTMHLRIIVPTFNHNPPPQGGSSQSPIGHACLVIVDSLSVWVIFPCILFKRNPLIHSVCGTSVLQILIMRGSIDIYVLLSHRSRCAPYSTRGLSVLLVRPSLECYRMK